MPDADERNYKAFWSYVHFDDEAEQGRISKLAHLISQRVQLITGEPFPIFLDHDGIEWGAKWQMTIDDALRTTRFFIPVLTPSYFKSAACRDELVKFTKAAQALHLKELIFPIYYTDVPDFAAGVTSDDVLVEQAKEFQ